VTSKATRLLFTLGQQCLSCSVLLPNIPVCFMYFTYSHTVVSLTHEARCLHVFQLLFLCRFKMFHTKSYFTAFSNISTNSSYSIYFHFQTGGKCTDQKSYGSTQRTQTNVRFEVLRGVRLKIPVFWDIINGHGINAQARLQPSTHSNFISVSSDYSNGGPINI